MELENRKMLKKSLCAKVLDAGNKILLSPKLPSIKPIPIYVQCCGILIDLQQSNVLAIVHWDRMLHIFRVS